MGLKRRGREDNKSEDSRDNLDDEDEDEEEEDNDYDPRAQKRNR